MNTIDKGESRDSIHVDSSVKGERSHTRPSAHELIRAVEGLDDKVNLQDLRTELAEEISRTAREHSVKRNEGESHSPVAAEQKKVTLTDRILYPAEMDWLGTQYKYVVPSGIIAAVSTSIAGYTLAAGSGTLLPELVHSGSIFAPLLEINTVVSVVSGIVCLGSAVIRYIQERNYDRNTHGYGAMLTMTKVKPAEGTTIRQTFPELGNAVVGEIHMANVNEEFVSMTEPEFFGQNGIVILRRAMKDLFLLAKACEENDPQLEGIEYFVGPYSDNISKLYEKFGFTVRTPVYDQSIHRHPLYELYRRGNENAYEESGVRLLERPELACMITRDELIRNKEILKKVSHYSDSDT